MATESKQPTAHSIGQLLHDAPAKVLAIKASAGGDDTFFTSHRDTLKRLLKIGIFPDAGRDALISRARRIRQLVQSMLTSYRAALMESESDKWHAAAKAEVSFWDDYMYILERIDLVKNV